jgi:hypothetical protein
LQRFPSLVGRFTHCQDGGASEESQIELNEVLQKRLAVCLLAVLCLAGIAPSGAAICPLTGDWDGDSSTNVALWNDATRRALFDANETDESTASHLNLAWPATSRLLGIGTQME